MYCKNCGKEVSEKAIVCPGCGVPPLSEHNHCQHCGVPTQSNQIMCIKCGMGLDSPSGNRAIELSRGITPLDAQKTMRICIGLSLVFAMFGFSLSFALQTNLPSDLQIWLLEESERDMSVYEAVLGSVAIVDIVAIIVASVGLFMLKRWAAKLYLIAFVVMLILGPFAGPSVEHALSGTLISVASILSGLVIGLAFFSDALNPSPQSGPTTV